MKWLAKSTCQPPLRNLSRQPKNFCDSQGKTPRANGIITSRSYGMKSVAKYIKWSASQLLENLVFEIRTPVIKLQTKLRPSALKQFKRILVLPHSPKHSVIKRPQEMKKLKEAFHRLEKRLDYRPLVTYLKGEPGVGKTQLARMFADDFHKENSTADVAIATIDMSDFASTFRELAIKLGVIPDFAKGENLTKVAQRIKEILSEKKEWLLIIDNYNSALKLGHGQGM